MLRDLQLGTQGHVSLQKHIKEHHEEVRERPCPHPGCNKVFMIDRYLQRHVKLIHTGVSGPPTGASPVWSSVHPWCAACGHNGTGGQEPPGPFWEFIMAVFVFFLIITFKK